MGIFSWLRPRRSAGQPDEPSQPRKQRGRHSLIRYNYEDPKLAQVERDAAADVAQVERADGYFGGDTGSGDR
jgi:hypothetical protein